MLAVMCKTQSWPQREGNRSVTEALRENGLIQKQNDCLNTDRRSVPSTFWA
jgi:hypothetical protein